MGWGHGGGSGVLVGTRRFKESGTEGTGRGVRREWGRRRGGGKERDEGRWGPGGG